MTTKSDKDTLRHAEGRLPGPMTFYASGYSGEQTAILHTFLSSIGYENVPLKICTKNQLTLTLGEALSTDRVDEPLPEGALPYVLVFSGMKPTDVENVLGKFGQNGLPRPIFATTTESNLTFSVKELLKHLLSERHMAATSR